MYPGTGIFRTYRSPESLSTRLDDPSKQKNSPGTLFTAPLQNEKRNGKTSGPPT